MCRTAFYADVQKVFVFLFAAPAGECMNMCITALHSDEEREKEKNMRISVLHVDEERKRERKKYLHNRTDSAACS